MYADYLPACANEFPNDNPALHRGARWVCRLPLGAPRALLQVPAGDPSSVPLTPEAPSEATAAPAPEATAAPVPVAESAPPTAPFASIPAELTGPLDLDLRRIVLPHRVADVPPPPEFIFRPLPSSRRAAVAPAVFEPVAAPVRALPLLGYRVVDQRPAASRVERRWRVDVSPCLHVGGVPSLPAASALPVEPALPAKPSVSAELSLPAQPARSLETAAELDCLAQALFPDAPSAAEPDILASVAPLGGEPPSLPPQEPTAVQPPESEAPQSKKRQRRRATRVASTASLATAALAANAELTRALTEIESAFSERRSETPRAARKRRGRKAASAKPASGTGATRRRAANAV